MRIRVECHSGYRADEEPRALYLDGRRIAVVALVDRWFDPDCRYFKLEAEDGALYILRHDEHSDAWEMTFFQAAGAPGRVA